MLALRSEDGFVTVDLLPFHDELNVGEIRAVYQGSEVPDQVRDGQTVDLVLLEFPDVKDANVIEPLAPVEAAEDEELLGAYNASCVPLSPRRCLLEL